MPTRAQLIARNRKHDFTKQDIVRIAAKIWSRLERAEGRGTVRTVLEVAGFTVEPKRR